MKLPYASNAFVPQSKLTNYLLNRSHGLGGPKAAFLERFGFSIDAWQRLRLSLLLHVDACNVSRSTPTPYGTIYELVGPLNSPDGRNPVVRVVWLLESGTEEPRLLTLVPDRGR